MPRIPSVISLALVAGLVSACVPVLPRTYFSPQAEGGSTLTNSC